MEFPICLILYVGCSNDRTPTNSTKKRKRHSFNELGNYLVKSLRNIDEINNLNNQGAGRNIKDDDPDIVFCGSFEMDVT